MWVLQEEIPKHVGMLINNRGIEGPHLRHNIEALAKSPGIQRSIQEYAVTLEQILV